MTAVRLPDRPAALDLEQLDLGPPLPDTGRNVVPYSGAGAPALRDGDRRPPPSVEDPVSPGRLAPPTGRPVLHARYMSPRDVQDYSQDLYAAGILSFEDYEALAFQPDLHPDFNRTIGALTGEKAAPERPRDFIRKWEDRLEFAQRYYPSSSNEVRQAHRILQALQAFPRPSDIFGQGA